MWNFWIDVGGTFTDCLALSPDGVEHVIKVLSSGKARGVISARDGDRAVFDHSGSIDFKPLWAGSEFHLLSEHGQRLWTCIVESVDEAGNRFILSEALPEGAAIGTRFELDPGQHAPLVAIRMIIGEALGEPLPPMNVHLGTTRGTNALLTRSGARTAFVTTRGMGDLLTIGDQSRPALFDLHIRKPAGLYEVAIEIDERILADGRVEKAPDETEVVSQFVQLKNAGIESIAISLMFGYCYPGHEQIVARCARRAGFDDVCLSSEVAPLIKILPRSETTVLDAYLNPVIVRYLNKIESALCDGSRLQLMTSSGGLVPRSRFSGKDSVLSGPAGGVVGAARTCEQAGFAKMLGFDMGGTSTDVSRYDGRFELEFESKKADVRIVAPMMAVETVAAGGGSICRFDGTRLVVGPSSAGADPGPACYGRGGPLTVTDLNLWLGRIHTDRFPLPLNRDAVRTRLDELCGELRDSGFEYSNHQLAEGLLSIANNNMAEAIRSVSVARGYDPRDYVLMSFGGAGSQHCCAVARQIGIDRILDHPRSSILSAVGIQLADRTNDAVQSMLRPLEESTSDEIDSVFKKLERRVADALIDEGNDENEIEYVTSLDLRYELTDAFLTVPTPDDGDYRTAFERVHRQQFGYLQSRPVEVVAARLSGSVRGRQLNPTGELQAPAPAEPVQSQTMVFDGSEVSADIYNRDKLHPGNVVAGPAIIASRFSTTIVDPGWIATMLADHQLVIESTGNTGKYEIGDPGDAVDAVQLEIFNSAFSSIARQMGISLQKTSTSVNVKERLDFSCALFTAEGDLVVNAPHIPVHLGAMSESVRWIIKLNADVNDGDVFITNDPYAGGSHLPDITVVTPVFIEEQLVFWVASRSHHAEIGGKSPGSMPPDATALEEEGVVIRNFKLVDRGKGNFEGLEKILRMHRFPSRSPASNIADVKAQVASNRTGQAGLLQLVETRSLSIVMAYTKHIRSAAARKSERTITLLPDGEFSFEDRMDNGLAIRVRISIDGSQMAIDFTGTDPIAGDNLNANRGIVLAAVMYVVRCLIDEDIPLNEGVLDPVTVTLPECFLNPTAAEDPDKSPAIVGGNVETSQRVVDVLLGALGAAAASQGTMNNWLMGDDSFGYYETVGGGSGATENGNGADAVHVHMSNTRLTDPEILETRYPSILRKFAVRKESGGDGVNKGGNGMVREVEFTAPLTLSLLTGRRGNDEDGCIPFGMRGGGSGMPGRNLLIKNDGSETELPFRCKREVLPGERLRLETPGGGGWGRH
ncbi:MAG: hydantoinase B/oxoprolinase family protein [Planctomycetota bacterium]